MLARTGPARSIILAVAGFTSTACGGAGPSPTGLAAPPAATPLPTPTAAPSGSGGCSDTSLGVCRISDAGVRQIPISRAGANGLAVDTTSGLVYVVINGATAPWCGDRGQPPSGLSIVDPAAGRETAMVASGLSPVWPLVDAARGKVYVASSGGAGTLAVHQLGTGRLERQFTIGGRPHDLGLDPRGRLLLVSNTFDSSQTWISTVDVETGMVVTNLQVPELPHKVVVDERDRVGYAVSLGSGRITAVDLASGAKLREFGSGPIPQTSAMVFSPTRRRLYVAKTAGSTPTAGSTIVSLDVDSGALSGEMGTFTPGSAQPTRAWGGFGLDDAAGLLYAAMANTNFVVVVDIAAMKPVGVFEVAACPWAVALDVPRGVGYVSSNQAEALTVFDLARVKAALGR